MRNDEFSRQEVRESQATFHELTSQIQELEERVNLMNDSGEFQDVESVQSGRLSHAPRQRAVVPSTRGVLSRDQGLRPDTQKLLGTSGLVFLTTHLHLSTQHPHLVVECFILRILMLQMVTGCDQARSEFFHRILWLITKTPDLGGSGSPSETMLWIKEVKMVD